MFNKKIRIMMKLIINSSSIIMQRRCSTFSALISVCSYKVCTLHVGCFKQVFLEHSTSFKSLHCFHLSTYMSKGVRKLQLNIFLHNI